MYPVPQLRGDEKVEYVRKSRADDPLATVDEVLAKHEQMLTEWVAKDQAEGGPIPEKNKFREVVSGETLDGRPEMQRLLRLVESPKIKAVVCVEPQRLSRGDYEDIGRLVKILRYTNTLVMTPVYTYDLRDERDRDMFERELKRGNEYLEYNKRIMRNGKLLAASNGNYIGRDAPYGYKKVSYKEGRRTCRTLEPHPEEAPVVQLVFELYKNGVGPSHICAQLDAEHVKPMRSQKWAPESIVHMLTNEHYLGKVRWNYRPVSRKVEDGEIKKTRVAPEEYLLFEGKHPALIDQETWDAVQAIRGSIVPRKRSAELQNPLAGLLRCICGSPVAYKGYVVKGESVAAARYACHSSKACKQGSAQVSEVMDEVVRVLEQCVEDFEEKIKQGVDDSAELHRQLVARLEKRLADLQELEVRQWDEKTKGGMPDHVFARLNAQTVAEIEEVNQALCEARDSAPQHVDLAEKVVNLRTVLACLKDPDAPVKEQNKLLKACIERITYSRPQLPRGRSMAENLPFHLDFKMRI